MSDSLEPYLPISLPSGCKQYDVNPEDITIRPYIGADEIYLCQVNPVNLDHKYLLVLNNAVRGINPKDLTLGDRRYIMVWEYIQSYGGVIQETVVCPSCLAEKTMQVDLRQLDVVSLPDDVELPKEVVLPTSNKTVKLRLLTVGDEIAASNFEAKEEIGPLFRCARSMIDDTDVLERLEFLKGTSALDIATIRGFHEQFDHGPDMRIKFTCDSCGEVDVVNVPFRLDLIFPRGDTLTGSVVKGV